MARVISVAMGVWGGFFVVRPAVSVLGYIGSLSQNGMPISWMERAFVILPAWILLALSACGIVISGILLFGNFTYPQQLRSLGWFQLITAVGFCLMALFLGFVLVRHQGTFFIYRMGISALKAFVWYALAALVTLIGTRRRTTPRNVCSPT